MTCPNDPNGFNNNDDSNEGHRAFLTRDLYFH